MNKSKLDEKNIELVAAKRQQREEEALKRFARGRRSRKTFPAMSVLNPFLLKMMRQILKHKYIKIFKRKVTRMRLKIEAQSSSEDSA